MGQEIRLLPEENHDIIWKPFESTEHAAFFITGRRHEPLSDIDRRVRFVLRRAGASNDVRVMQWLVASIQNLRAMSVDLIRQAFHLAFLHHSDDSMMCIVNAVSGCSIARLADAELEMFEGISVSPVMWSILWNLETESVDPDWQFECITIIAVSCVSCGDSDTLRCILRDAPGAFNMHRVIRAAMLGGDRMLIEEFASPPYSDYEGWTNTIWLHSHEWIADMIQRNDVVCISILIDAFDVRVRKNELWTMLSMGRIAMLSCVCKRRPRSTIQKFRTLLKANRGPSLARSTLECVFAPRSSPLRKVCDTGIFVGNAVSIPDLLILCDLVWSTLSVTAPVMF